MHSKSTFNEINILAFFKGLRVTFHMSLLFLSKTFAIHHLLKYLQHKTQSSQNYKHKSKNVKIDGSHT